MDISSGLFQGIAGAGDALARGIKNYRDERKKDNELTKTFETVEKATIGMVEKGFLPPEFLKSFKEAQTPDAKRGALTGLSQVLVLAQQAREQQRATEATSYLDIAKQRAGRETEADAAQKRFAALASQGLQTPPPDGVAMDMPDGVGLEQPELNPATIGRWAAESGLATPGTMTSLLGQETARERAVLNQRWLEESRARRAGAPDAANSKLALQYLKDIQANRRKMLSIINDPDEKESMRAYINHLEKQYSDLTGMEAPPLEEAPEPPAPVEQPKPVTKGLFDWIGGKLFGTKKPPANATEIQAKAAALVEAYRANPTKENWQSTAEQLRKLTSP